MLPLDIASYLDKKLFPSDRRKTHLEFPFPKKIFIGLNGGYLWLER